MNDPEGQDGLAIMLIGASLTLVLALSRMAVAQALTALLDMAEDVSKLRLGMPR